LDRGAVLTSVVSIDKISFNVSLRHVEEFLLFYGIWIKRFEERARDRETERERQRERQRQRERDRKNPN